MRGALLLVWLAVSLITGMSVLAPFVLPHRVIAATVPACESKRRFGRECILCGCTTGFLAISRGDLQTAAESNALAIPLFGLFAVNGVVAAAFLIRSLEADRLFTLG